MKKTLAALTLAALFGAAGTTFAAEPVDPIEPVKIENPALVELGKMLYFEPRLSRSGFISCNSCHNLATGGVDNLKNQTIAYLGDAANNMANSYLLGGAVAGMDVRVAGPYGYLPRPDIVADAKRVAAETGGSILVTTDPREAVADADCIFTDTWVSMGEEAEYAIRSKPFWDYQVNDELMALAKPDALFQHCLPAYRGYEVTEDVIDGPQSVVFDEAENRLHAQKAVMVTLMSSKED